MVSRSKNYLKTFPPIQYRTIKLNDSTTNFQWKPQTEKLKLKSIVLRCYICICIWYSGCDSTSTSHSVECVEMKLKTFVSIHIDSICASHLSLDLGRFNSKFEWKFHRSIECIVFCSIINCAAIFAHYVCKPYKPILINTKAPIFFHWIRSFIFAAWHFPESSSTIHSSFCKLCLFASVFACTIRTRMEKTKAFFLLLHFSIPNSK